MQSIHFLIAIVEALRTIAVDTQLFKVKPQIIKLNEKIKRIESVLEYIDCETLDIRKKSLDFMKRNIDRIKDVNFRTLIKITKIFAEYPEDEELALYTVI